MDIKYYKGVVDSTPIPVRVIQVRKAKTNDGRCEISRNLDCDGCAGFWVGVEELYEVEYIMALSSFRAEWDKEDDKLWNYD